MDKRLIINFVIAPLLVWTILIGGFFTWARINQSNQIIKLATKEAHTHFDKDLAIRIWATSHGGIYVPTDDRTPPNPNLKHIKERDIETPSGKKLTLMNPAYMLRQLMNDYSDLYGVKGRITSLKYLNPLNAPDEWETKALKAFEHGTQEVFELSDIDGQPYLRLMKPLTTQEGCLKCHAFQGYKVGDVRGAVGVSVPMSSYYAIENRQIRRLVLTFGLIWIIGAITIFWAGRRGTTLLQERFNALEALQESEERYRRAIEASSGGIWEWNILTNEEFLSPRWCEIVGYAPDDPALAHTFDGWAGRIHPEDKEHVMTILENHLRKGERYDVDYRYRHRSGEYRWQNSKGQAAYDQSGRPISMTGYITDISQQKRDEEEKKQLEQKLQQSHKMESVGRLAGGIAHDFNNMLSIILGNAEMLLDDFDSEGPHSEKLKEISSAAERSADLTRQLLAFARKQIVAPKVLNLNNVLANMLKMLDRLIGEHINLVWLPDDNIEPVKIDPSQVDQILANLCVNARDAISGVGTITISTANILIDENKSRENAEIIPGDYVVLTVSDNGSGIDQATLSHIFEPFYTTKDISKGTGLGLATVYGIVQQNHGFIEVDSEPGKGTTFKIYFRQHHEEIPATADTAADNNTLAGSETILLVEDEKAILKMTTIILETLGYAVLAASTPGEAIKIANNSGDKTIDLLVTDIIMPEMNGLALAESIKKAFPGIKSLFMSGYTEDAIANHGVLHSGLNFINKPFTRHELAKKIREVIDN